MNRIPLRLLVRPLAAKSFAYHIAFLVLTHVPVGARAESLIVEAGQSHTLNADLVLDGDDSLQIRGTAEKPCVLIGNRHAIRSGPKWTGALAMTHTTIRDLGGLPTRTPEGLIRGPGTHALELKARGKASVRIEHCTLDACAAIQAGTRLVEAPMAMPYHGGDPLQGPPEHRRGGSR